MSSIHRYRPLLLLSAVLVVLTALPVGTLAQGRGGGGGGARGGGGGAPGGGGGGAARGGGGGPAGPSGPAGRPGGGAVVRGGGPGYGGPGYGGRPGYGYGGYYPGYGARTTVVIGGAYYRPYWSVGFGWGYPYYGYYGYYGYPYACCGYAYPYPYGYGYGVYDDTAGLRLEVTPRTTQVFVDGYIAGTVDDFDGMFQRLRLPPGSHRITLYLEGYHTVTQNLYLGRGADQKITYQLQPLSAGETAEPPPVAADPQDQDPDQADHQVEVMPRRPEPRQVPPPYQPPPSSAPSDSQARYGTLSVRVIPGDAEIFVDGERWASPSGQDRMIIQLADGRHHVEVRKDGFDTYQEDVLIRRGSTLALNVSLLRGTEGR